MIWLWVCLLATWFTPVPAQGRNGKLLGCFLSEFSVGNLGGQIGDAEADLCHLVALGQLKVGQASMNLEYSDGLNELMSGALAQKQRNPGLKVVLSMDGLQGRPLSSIIANPSSRKTFLTRIAKLQSKGIDGLCLMWAEPGTQDRQNYAKLVKELREIVGDGFLIMVFVSSKRPIIDHSLDLESMSQSVNYFILNGCNFQPVRLANKTIVHAPLNSEDQRNVNSLIDYVTQIKKVPPHKLLLGLSSCGLEFELETYPVPPSQYIGARARYIQCVPFSETCLRLADGWTNSWHEWSSTPVAVSEDLLISYDNPRSFKLKMELAMRKRLGGAFLISLAGDDQGGQCGQGSYPLTTSLNRYLESYQDKSPPPHQHHHQHKVQVQVENFSYGKPSH